MEYQRILSYLYLYEHHVKKQCVGFVKAEYRTDLLKLTVEIDDDKLMEGMELEVLFYEPEQSDNTFRFHSMERLDCDSRHLEVTRFYGKEMLPQDFRLEKQHGVLLRYQDNFYYGSVWVGNDLPKQLSAVTEESEILSENLDRKESNQEPLPVEVTLEKSPEIESQKETIVVMEPEAEKIESEEPDDSEDIKPLEVESEEMQEVEQKEVEPVIEPIEKENEIYVSHPAFLEGKQISLAQLKTYDDKTGSFAKNSFLLQSYQKYDYVIWARVMYGGQERECIGVPGVYDNRERYMAEQFHFPVFLPSTENKTKTGQFGYWLHLSENTLVR